MKSRSGEIKDRLKKDWTVININVTWFCPVHCSYCHVTTKASHEDRLILSPEKLIAECKVGADLGVKEYRFSGGEPASLGDRLFEYADIVFEYTGKKPAVLTSGVYLNDDWLKKARGKFSGIYISVENPLSPLQTVVDSTKVLRIIKDNFSDDLPIKYGVTLITAPQFKNISQIFDLFYKNVDQTFMPQFDYPCLKDFTSPTKEELEDIACETTKLFKKYGLIPFYFVDVIGSLLFLKEKFLRVVVNLNPDGTYDINDSMLNAFKMKYSWLDYSFNRQQNSPACQKCEWFDTCRYHSIGLMYDWCNLRGALFGGMYEGLKLHDKK